MKKFVLTILAIMVAASPAFAQFGDISAYSDEAGTSCSIADAGAGIRDVFLLLKHTSGATALKFVLQQGTGGTLSYVSDAVVAGFLSIGNSQSGIEVAFPTCQVGDVYFMKVTYFGAGTSAPCSYINVLEAADSPNPGEVIIVDCTTPFGNVQNVARGQAIINPDGTCQCDVPVNERTWGSIKALYR